MKFTARYVENLKPQASRYIVQEDNAHGNGTLGLRVSPNGGKSWLYSYHFGGRVRRMTLGRFPAMSVADAHAAFGEAMRKRSMGLDPGAMNVETNVASREAPTFAELADQYMERHARPNKRKKSADSDHRILHKDVLSRWGAHKAEAIQRKDVRALITDIVDRGAPIQANRTLALVRKVYNWGLGEDLVSHNPCLGVRAPGKERQRERVLSDDEIRAFLVALPETAMSAESKLALRLLLLTAQRCGEVLGLRWDEIDASTGWWTIPSHKAKNGKSHRVPLSEQALAVLAEARLLNPDRETVFPSPRGDAPMVETAVARALRKNLARIGADTDSGRFTPHDLRRTAASHITSMGQPRLVVSKILNHAERGVTAVYDRHSYDAEKRTALDAWGRKVAALADGRRLSVVA